MVNAIKDSATKDQAQFEVNHYVNKNNCIVNDRFIQWIHKSKTVHQFLNIVAMYYNLNAHSFYLTLKSFTTVGASETRIQDSPKLIVDDDRLISTYGVVFDGVTQYHFILSKIDPPEECDQAQLYVSIHKECKLYPLTVDKNKTGSQLYEQVLQLCQNDNFNTSYFVLTFNYRKIDISNEMVKMKITHNDTRLLSEIGVVYGHGVKNHFEVSLDSITDNVESNTPPTLCLPIHDEESEIRDHPLIQNSPVTPMLPSTRLLYHKLMEKPCKPTGFRGLVNQALTCYINSLVQALYMTPEFRNAIYHCKFDFKDIDELKSISFQLQKLFLNLQTSPCDSVETKDLTRSFGWLSNELLQQHDVQELCRVMFDALEKEFKNTTHVNLINQLYQGTFIDYVKCLECGVEKSRVDTFLDIPLSIRPFGCTQAYTSIVEALQGYIKPEILNGNDQYFCEQCNKKCDAHKGLKFSKFPYILTLHLMRFEFNYNTMEHIKLNDKIVFPLILNLNGFISNLYNSQDYENKLIYEHLEEQFEPVNMSGDGSCTKIGSSTTSNEINQNVEGCTDKCMDEDIFDASSNPENEPTGPYMYELYAIMVHSGNALKGHYYAFIKDFKTDKWLCFNDESVTEITMEHVATSFGGEQSDRLNSNNNAYMLMYRQIDLRRNRNAMTEEEFPPHLKDLHNVLKQKCEMGKQLAERERYHFKIAVYFLPLEGKRLFDCYKTTTICQLKTMAMEYFEVTQPCQLIIYNRLTDQVIENLDLRSDSLVSNLKCTLPRVVSLQKIDNENVLPTSKNITMKLFLINLDDNEEDVNVSRPVKIEVEPNKFIRDLNKLISLKYNISNESTLHFVVQSSPEPFIILEPTIECSSVDINCVFVFIERHVMSQTAINHKMINIIKRYNTVINTIQLKFVLPSQNIACNLSIKNQHMETNPQDSAVVSNSNVNSDQCSNNIIDNERMNEDNAIEDIQVNPPILEHDPLKVYDNGKLDENNENGTENNNGENTELQSNKKYMFMKLDFKPISENAAEDNKNELYAFIDKRMSANELKNNLAPIINIQSDFIILKRFTAETEFEELVPSKSLENLRNHEIIHVSVGEPLKDGQYRGVIFLIEPLEHTNIFMKKVFDWIITVGTSVLDTKKELLAKINETHNINIPLERCRLRKKKKSALLQCYFDEEIWNEDIGQGWEMVVADLKDNNEVKLDKDNQLMFVNYIEANGEQQCKIFELEFIVETASTISVPQQLVTSISTKFNVPEDQIELGYLHSDLHSDDIIWKTSASKWSYNKFDYTTTVIFFRIEPDIKNVPSKWSKKPKDCSLKIGFSNKKGG